MSGGNQQKAIIARELDRDPEIVIAVQPVRGLDVGAIEYIHKQLVEQRNEGKAVLLVSLELDEVMDISDRIIVMYEGEIVADVNPKEITVEELGLYMAGAKRSVKNENKWKNIWRGDGIVNFSSSILAIVCGLLFGFIILLSSNPQQAYYGFMMILQGGFTDGIQGIGQMLYLATPIIMTGLSVGFAFKTGLFNIGASGQFTAGAFAAVFVGVKFTFLPPGLHCLAALLAAILAGAIWGLVPGLLKAFFNVNEVISSIMMNYIGMYLVNMMIQRTVYDQVKNQTMAVADGANLPKAGLDKLFPGTNINIGILIAILCVILIYIILNKTTFGYELKACGKIRTQVSMPESMQKRVLFFQW